MNDGNDNVLWAQNGSFPVVVTIHNVTGYVHCSKEIGMVLQNVMFVSQVVQPFAAQTPFPLLRMMAQRMWES